MNQPLAIRCKTNAPLELLTVEQLKAQARIEYNEEDALLKQYISVAQTAIARRMARAISPSTLVAEYRDFNCPDFAICYPPVVSVDSVVFYSDEYSETISPNDYLLTEDDNTRILTLKWYIAERLRVYDRRRMVIEFRAGYSSVDDVPMPIRQAIALLAADYYNCRANVDEKSYKEIPVGIQFLIAPYCANKNLI